MKPLLSAALVLVACFSPGCATRVEITTDYVAGTDFSHYRSVGLMKAMEAAMPIGGPTVLASIRAAVEESMTARGYTVSPPGGADLLVMIHGRVNPRVTVHDYGYGMPTHPWRGGYFSSWEERFVGRDATVINVGRLTVDVIDRRTQELVWRGVAQKEGVPDTPDAKRLGAVVRRILQQFPHAR